VVEGNELSMDDLDTIYLQILFAFSSELREGVIRSGVGHGLFILKVPACM